MFGISRLIVAGFALVFAGLIGVILFGSGMLPLDAFWRLAEEPLTQVAIAMAAAGLALAWRGARRRQLAASRTGLDRLVADLPVAVYQGFRPASGPFQREYMTPSFARVTGWTVEQVPDYADYIALIPEEDRPIAEAHHAKAARDGEAISEYRLRRPDGEIGWFRHQTRVMSSTRNGVELIGTLSDITATHELTEQTEASEVRFRGFLEASPDAIIITDDAGRIVMASQRVEALFGYKSEELVGHPHGILIPVRQRDAHALHVRGYMDAPGVRDMGLGNQLYARRRDGSEFPAEISLSPYRDREGLFVVTAVRDVTHRLQAQEQLRQAQKMEAVGQLTGGVAHDFNNLLAIILGNAELLEWGDTEFDAETSALIAAIGRAAQRAAQLTRQLLAFSREQPLNPEITDLNIQIGGMSDLLRRTLGVRVSVYVSLADGLWLTRVDRNQFENALLNLAINARDAMPEGGQLTIETGNTLLDDDYAVGNAGVSPGPYVMIAVSDTGTGMTVETSQRAFDPFYTTKPAGHGTGLGLSQVYGFVKQSGGHIQLLSEPGHGTTVNIHLPRHLATGEPESIPAGPQGLALARGSEMVLVVEDEAALRDFSVEALTRLGYRVLSANGASAALRTLKREPGIGLMFTDIGLSGFDGRQLANVALRRHPALKVLFTTGYARNGAPADEITGAGVHLLPKPFTIGDLARKIRNLLDQD